ncbi:VWA domain-containing protein [Granulicella aggregans]|uniref:VWA domain-containing protein n=1 Tax=Granulicella aggregans TaxID=474949 RepID=UPI0021DFA89B|nr:VWA domain-containing protein [Granulicella aggregans]
MSGFVSRVRVVAVLLYAVSGFGQAGVAPSPVPPARMYLNVEVTLAHGEPVTGLQQPDFSLLNNKAPQAITTFSAIDGTVAPTEVVLLIDVMNSQEITMSRERPELDKFLLARDGKMTYPTTMGVLTEKGIHIQPEPSTDGKGLKEALDRYLPSVRANHMLPGFHGGEERVELSLRALSGLVAQMRQRPGRKLLLWVSPGWPVFSGPAMYLSDRQQQELYHQIASISEMLRQARVTLYCIDPLGSSESVFQSQSYQQYLKPAAKPSQATPGELSLQVLATQSGGLVLGASGDVAGLIEKAVDDTRSFYEISFEPKPAEAPDEYHRLEVKVAKPGAVARTRWGYYAQP